MSHFLLDASQHYEEETHEEVKRRYTQFGKDLYDMLKEQEPTIFAKLKFYKATHLLEKTTWGAAETENSYAIYDHGEHSFGIQLEPLTEVICLYNQETQIEIGDLDGNNYYKEAIKFIKNSLL